MILSDKRILEEMKRGTIVVKPFNRKYLGSNSYDVHLGDWLAMYNEETLDCKKHNKVHYFKVLKEGMILAPSKLYLGVTKEYTESHARVPFLERKSSIGRLGIDIHATAGKRRVMSDSVTRGPWRSPSNSRYKSMPACRPVSSSTLKCRRCRSSVQQEKDGKIQKADGEAGRIYDGEEFSVGSLAVELELTGRQIFGSWNRRQEDSDLQNLAAGSFGLRFVKP